MLLQAGLLARCAIAAGLWMAVVSPVQAADAALLPVPAKAEIAEAEKAVRERIKQEMGATAKDDYAQTLAKEARESTAAPATRFVMYREAAALCVQDGNFVRAAVTINNMCRFFEPDAATFTTFFTAANAAVKKADDATGLGWAASYAADALATYDQLPVANTICTQTAATAARLKEEAIQNRLLARSREFTQLQSEASKIALHLKTLETKPDDPTAHAAVGRHLAFVKNNWVEALPHMAKGAASPQKTAAEKEAAAATPEDWLAVADLWWAIGDQFPPGLMRERAQRHSANCQEQAPKDANDESRWRKRAAIIERLNQPVRYSEDFDAIDVNRPPAPARISGGTGASIVNDPEFGKVLKIESNAVAKYSLRVNLTDPKYRGVRVTAFVKLLAPYKAQRDGWRNPGIDLSHTDPRANDTLHIFKFVPTDATGWKKISATKIVAPTVGVINVEVGTGTQAQMLIDDIVVELMVDRAQGN